MMLFVPGKRYYYVRKKRVGPLRLLILAVLLYIGYRLIKNSFSKKNDSTRVDKDATDGRITDVLVEDPVCHKLVPKQQAQRLQHDGQTTYFCSTECREKFVAEKGEHA